MLLTSVFSKENSAISLEEWVLVFKVFTTATLRVKWQLNAVVFVLHKTTVHSQAGVSLAPLSRVKQSWPCLTHNLPLDIKSEPLILRNDQKYGMYFFQNQIFIVPLFVKDVWRTSPRF